MLGLSFAEQIHGGDCLYRYFTFCEQSPVRIYNYSRVVDNRWRLIPADKSKKFLDSHSSFDFSPAFSREPSWESFASTLRSTLLQIYDTWPVDYCSTSIAPCNVEEFTFFPLISRVLRACSLEKDRIADDRKNFWLFIGDTCMFIDSCIVNLFRLIEWSLLWEFEWASHYIFNLK